jgi:HEAT repeat protein
MKQATWLLVLASSVALGQDPAPEPQPPLEALEAQPAAQAEARQEALVAQVERVEAHVAALAAQVDARPAIAMQKATRGRAEHEYRRGTEHLDERRWEQAIESFDRAAQAKSVRADAALYWKAYAQHKLGRRDEALATLGELQKTHANSRWLNDAKRLEQEVRQAGGQPVSPEQQADEDLKLYAINALIHTEPERAVPLLEKILFSNSAPKLKERALFVLAQTDWPKGVELLTKAARGGVNPDLQVKAVQYLGSHRGKQSATLLAEVYSSSQDTEVKRAVIDAWSNMKEKERLLAAAKSESAVELRERAVHGLGHARAEAELWQLYQSEQVPEVRREIINALYHARAYDRIIALAKTETDPELRRRAIQMLGGVSQPDTVETLRGLYWAESEPKTKQAIIESLFRRKNSQALIEIARKETSPELKQNAVQLLSRMRTKEASDFLIELLNK